MPNVFNRETSHLVPTRHLSTLAPSDDVLLGGVPAGCLACLCLFCPGLGLQDPKNRLTLLPVEIAVNTIT